MKTQAELQTLGLDAAAAAASRMYANIEPLVIQQS